MVRRTENWKNHGRISVSRDSKGRFISWKIINPLNWGYTEEYGEKQVSIYGQASNGVGERYDFYGSGHELYKAIQFAHFIVPRYRFVSVSAREFLTHPNRYGERGFWIDKEIES